MDYSPLTSPSEVSEDDDTIYSEAEEEVVLTEDISEEQPEEDQ